VAAPAKLPKRRFAHALCHVSAARAMRQDRQSVADATQSTVEQIVDRRDFLKLTGAGLGGLMLPAFAGRVIAAEQLLSKLDVGTKKKLADVALQAAKAGGAKYCDVRIGRYLRQFVVTREDKVQNVVNTESCGIGIRVIANGTWGFAATSELTPDAVAKAAKQAVAIAKANSKVQAKPVELAPVKGVGEVSWATPIVKNAMAVPIKDKVDLLLGVNADAMKAGASFINSILFAVNEQKYFASTDGSYIDQDVHRIWAPMQVTAVDKGTGSSASAPACPRRAAWASNISTARRKTRSNCLAARRCTAIPTTCARTRSPPRSRPRKSSLRSRSSRASTTLCSIRRTPG
jgi:hypothetical protein